MEGTESSLPLDAGELGRRKSRADKGSDNSMSGIVCVKEPR